MSEENAGRLVPAWQGDWRPRLHQRIKERGFSTVADFAASAPQATLQDLSRLLGEGDVAPVQIEKELLLEAVAKGDVERCVRDLVARRIREIVGGWPGPRNGRDEAASWKAIVPLSRLSVPPEFEKAAESVVDCLLEAD